VERLLNFNIRGRFLKNASICIANIIALANMRGRFSSMRAFNMVPMSGFKWTPSYTCGGRIQSNHLATSN